MGPAFLRKYDTLLVAGTTSIDIPIIKAGEINYAVGGDWTPAAGDVKVLIDATGAANITNLPTAIVSGNTAVWRFIITAAELQGKSIKVVIADAATKAVEDQAFIIETFGHASAMYQVNYQDVAAFGLTNLANTNEITAARMGALTDLINGGRLDLILDAINAKTTNLPTDPADQSLIITATDALLVAINALNNITVADILAGTADTISLTNHFTRLNAFIKGNLAKTGTAAARRWRFKKEDGSTDAIDVTVNENTDVRSQT